VTLTTTVNFVKPDLLLEVLLKNMILIIKRHFCLS